MFIFGLLCRWEALLMLLMFIVYILFMAYDSHISEWSNRRVSLPELFALAYNLMLIYDHNISPANIPSKKQQEVADAIKYG